MHPSVSLVALAAPAGIMILFFQLSAGCKFTIQDGVATRFVIEPNTLVVFCLGSDTGQRVTTTHVIAQAHVHKGNVTVSLDIELQDGRYAHGSNVGVVSSLKDGDDLTRWFFVSYVSDGDDKHVTFMAKAYGASDPVPGGCNLELPLKNDPNIYLRNIGSHLSAIEFAYGDSGIEWKCGSPLAKNSVQYDVYQFFMHERDLSADYFHSVLGQILDPRYVTSNALYVTSLSSNDVTRLKFPAYGGIGTVFIVIMAVTRDNVITRASYVPTITYFCNDLEKGCSGEDELQIKIVVSVLALVGLLICFCGHRFFKTEMFFFGALVGMLAANILLERFSWWDFSTNLYISIGAGVAGGVIWWAVWVFFGVPPISVALVTLLLGYVLASIVFNASPLGVTPWLHFSAYFHSVLFSAVLIPCIIGLCVTREMNVLSCAIIGSFFVVLAADICLHGAFKYILLNTIWRSSTPSFVEAFCLLPFQLSDIVLYIIWALVAISGTICHYFLEKNRPPFPPCPWTTFRSSRREAPSRTESESCGNADDDDEHRPLLFNAGRRRDSQAANRVWREQPVEQLGHPAEESLRAWWLLPHDSATPSAMPVVSTAGTPPPPYEEEAGPSGRAE